MEQRILTSELNKNIENTYYNLRETCKAWRRGSITEYEMRNGVENELYNGLYGFIGRKNLYLV